ncbi:hypothetical protein L9F63_001304, partial [Diploptera punctata]
TRPDTSDISTTTLSRSDRFRIHRILLIYFVRWLKDTSEPSYRQRNPKHE